MGKIRYEEAKKINIERTSNWIELLSRNNATAVIMIGIRHDEKSGDLVLTSLASAQFTNEKIKGLLNRAAELLP